MQTLTYLYFASLAAATITGLIKYRNSLPIHLKGIILMMPYILLNETAGVFFRHLIKSGSMMPQYSIIMLLEFLVYAYFFREIILSNLVKKIITFFILLFPVFWYCCVFLIFKLTDWNSYVFLTGGTFSIIWALIYCYQILTSTEEISIGRCSEFWLTLGILVFYTCEVPFMGLYNFLVAKYPSLIMKLQMGLQVVNIIMYSLFSYAFICKETNTTKYS